MGGADLMGALHSPHEIRVESRFAIPRITAFLAEQMGVTVMTKTAVHEVAPPRLATSRGVVEAGQVVVCPGDDFNTLYPDRIASYGLTRCRLSMLRLANPGVRLPGAIMSDLGLVRYRGYGALPEARVLEARLRAEVPRLFDNGVHLIVAQGTDGSLIVGDSHHYADVPPPCSRQRRGGYPSGICHRFGRPCAPGDRALDRHLCCRGGPDLPDRYAARECAAGDRHQRHGCLHRFWHCRKGAGRSGGPQAGSCRMTVSSFPIKAVIFDWAGTMIDFGCMAPVEALISVFAREDLALTDAEARADMGKAKLDHLRAILAKPELAARWHAARGHLPDEGDVQALYARLEPAMQAAAAASATLIPGVVETVKALRQLGIRIGSGTGYTREMMAPILPLAAAQGYAPEVVICAGETPSGRPAPLMTWAALIALDAWPARCCIKVDDAPVGIVEGREAGCWTVGLAGSGNGMGLSHADYRALPEAQRQTRCEASAQVLRDAGADYVIEDVSQLMPVVHAIARRLAKEKPQG
jgi:phosphonoacetaldehyde hydrolase